MAERTERRRIFLGMMGGAYRDETVTTLFRLADAALTAGHSVEVWCCGSGVHIASETQGARKPRDVSCAEPIEAPTTSSLVAALGGRHADSFRWNVCRYCAEEHGAGAPVAPARLRPSLHFAKLMLEADVTLIMGLK
jgi:sulfur relay (sulfurtransferase) complex TusBCD TusD component (DsrE family)